MCRVRLFGDSHSRPQDAGSADAVADVKATGGAPGTGGRTGGSTTMRGDASPASGGVSGSPAPDGSVEAGASEAGAPVPLPDGSREMDGIVNLVDADAAAELESFLTDQKPIF